MSKIYIIKAIILILSCTGSSIVIITAWQYGMGLSPDSVEYLAAANNLMLERGFLSYNGLPITEWPPLYPILLFLLSYSFGVSTAFSAALLNVLLFGLIIYKSGMILTEYLKSNSIIIIGLLSVLFSIPVFSESLWARSELLFIFFTTLYIDLLISYIKRNNLLTFIMLVCITALAILTRYIGVTLILTTIITILFFSSERTKRKIVSIIVYSVLSVIPISIWLIRNYMLSGTLFGERGAPKNPFYDNIHLTIVKILEWVIPEHLIFIKIIFLVVISCIILLLGLLLLNKIEFKNIFLNIDKRIIVILSLFISGYLLFLILISSIKAHNPIDSRLLSPIYIPGVILLFIILQAYYNHINSIKHFNILRISFFSLLILGSVEPISSTIKTINYHYNNGGGYSGISWQKDNKSEWLKDIKKSYIKDSVIYCNDPFTVYYLTNTYAMWSPRKTFYSSDEIYIRLIDLEGVWPPEKAAYLVWFKEIEFHRTSLYTIKELATISELKMIDSSDTGFLYFIKSK